MRFLSEQSAEHLAKKVAYADYLCINLIVFTIIVIVPICCLVILFGISLNPEYIFIKQYIPYLQELIANKYHSVATAHFLFYLYAFFASIYYLYKTKLPTIDSIIFTLHSFTYTMACIICPFVLIIFWYINWRFYGHIYSNCLPNDLICHINQSKPSTSITYVAVFLIAQTFFWVLTLASSRFVSTRHIEEKYWFIYDKTKTDLRRF